MEPQNYKIYRRSECAVFLKTAERFGGLSNMAGGYTLSINGIRILTSEALYQACRFPHLPEVQKLIIGQTSPMTAKMKSKPHRKDSRSDWDSVRIQIMRWCLHVKLVQHWDKFGALLLSTGDKPIVEESYRDPFWGAKPVDAETLSGMNVLGCLLVELREQLRNPEAHKLWNVEPPSLPQFLFLNKQIGVIEGPKPKPKSVYGPLLQGVALSEQVRLDSNVSGSVEATTWAALNEVSSLKPYGEVEMPVAKLPIQLDTTAIQYMLPLEDLVQETGPQKAKPPRHNGKS